MKKSTIKKLGLGASIVGIGISLFANWLSEKERDQVIEEKVMKALADKGKES